MFNYLESFFRAIYEVFLRWGDGPPVAFYNYYSVDGVLYDYYLEFGLSSDQFVALLCFLTLLGLCIFLFYQVYKVIHALIGGVYE